MLQPAAQYFHNFRFEMALTLHSLARFANSRLCFGVVSGRFSARLHRLVSCIIKRKSCWIQMPVTFFAFLNTHRSHITLGTRVMEKFFYGFHRFCFQHQLISLLPSQIGDCIGEYSLYLSVIVLWSRLELTTPQGLFRRGRPLAQPSIYKTDSFTSVLCTLWESAHAAFDIKLITSPAFFARS